MTGLRFSYTQVSARRQSPPAPNGAPPRYPACRNSSRIRRRSASEAATATPAAGLCADRRRTAVPSVDTAAAGRRQGHDHRQPMNPNSRVIPRSFQPYRSSTDLASLLHTSACFDLLERILRRRGEHMRCSTRLRRRPRFSSTPPSPAGSVMKSSCCSASAHRASRSVSPSCVTLWKLGREAQPPDAEVDALRPESRACKLRSKLSGETDRAATSAKRVPRRQKAIEGRLSSLRKTAESGPRRVEFPTLAPQFRKISGVTPAKPLRKAAILSPELANRTMIVSRLAGAFKRGFAGSPGQTRRSAAYSDSVALTAVMLFRMDHVWLAPTWSRPGV